MPIHLPPISRRRFLRNSCLAGAGLVVAAPLLASEKPPFFALLSDIHLAADKKFVARGVNVADHMKAVSAEILGRPDHPEALIVNGDCAYNTGLVGDYAVVAELLKPVREAGVPVHLALGNHDHRGRFREALNLAPDPQSALPERQVAIVETALVNWFIMDSLEETAVTPGLLGRDQLDWLARSLDQRPTKPAIVLVHHNPGLTGNLGLKDTAAFLELIRSHKQVKAYIYGHTHVWRVEKDASGIYFVNLPAVSYVFQDGEPTGWVEAKLRPDGMDLQLRCTDQSHKFHGQTHQLRWREA